MIVVDICTATVSHLKWQVQVKQPLTLEISIEEIIDDIHNPETNENNQK